METIRSLTVLLQDVLEILGDCFWENIYQKEAFSWIGYSSCYGGKSKSENSWRWAGGPGLSLKWLIKSVNPGLWPKIHKVFTLSEEWRTTSKISLTEAW